MSWMESDGGSSPVGAVVVASMAGRAVDVVVGKVVVALLVDRDGTVWESASCLDEHVLEPAETPDPPGGLPAPQTWLRAKAEGTATVTFVGADPSTRSNVSVRVRPEPVVWAQPEMPPDAGLSWDELFVGEPIRTAQGQHLHQRKEQTVRTDFVLRAHDEWQAFDAAGSGAIQIGSSVVFVDHGVEVLRRHDATGVYPGEWRSALTPPRGSKYPGSTTVEALREAMIIERPCWQVDLRLGERQWSLFVDRATGIELADTHRRKFEWLDTNTDRVAEIADWVGPVDHGRASGFAGLADADTPDWFDAYATVRTGPCSFTERLEDARPLQEALQWAQQRAAYVEVRRGGVRFSAGRKPLESLPPWTS